jgi:hypothetical protein
MNRKSTPAIPEPIAQLQRQLDQFRSTQPRRTRLPDSLWRQAAVELARQHGVYFVAQPLRLDYMGLKKLGELSGYRRKASRPAFVELTAPYPAALEEWVSRIVAAGLPDHRVQVRELGLRSHERPAL